VETVQRLRAAIDQQRLATEQQRTAQTANQAAVAAQRLATEEQRTATAATRAEKEMLALARAQERAAAAGKNGGLGPALPRTLDGLSGAAAAALKGFIGLQVITQGLDLAQVGAQAQGARTSFDALAQSANTTGAALLGSLRVAAQGTISDVKLIESANTGLLLSNGKIAKDLPRLIEIARASARATGQEIGFVFDSLVRGISRGSPQIIDNAGITLDAGKAFDTYAKSIGKSTDELTKADQQQATLNAVVAAGADIIAKTGGSADNAATSFARVSTAIDNLKTKAGGALATALAPAADGINAIATLSDKANESVRKAFSGASTFSDYQARIKGIGDEFASIGVKVQPLSQAQFNYAQSLVASGVAADQAHQKALDFNGSLVLIGQTQAVLASSGTVSAAAIDGISQAMVRVGSSSAAGAAFIQGLTQELSAHAITATQAAAGLAAYEAGLQRSAQAATSAAIANDEDRVALGQAQLARENANAAMADQITKTQQAAISAQQLTAVQNTLAGLGRLVAGGLLTSAQAAAQLAAQYGITTQAALALIQAQATIANKSVALAKAPRIGESRSDIDDLKHSNVIQNRKESLDAANAAARAEENYQKVIGNDAPAIARAKRELAQLKQGTAEYYNTKAKLAQLEQDAERDAKRAAGGAKGARSPKLTDQQRLNNTLLADQEKADDRFAQLDQDHRVKLLDIEKDYQRKSLDQQRANEVSKRQSQADFYERLTTSDLNKKSEGKNASAADAANKEALAKVNADYQAAFAKSQELAQAGNAKLAADYLALKQRQAEQELSYQEALAKARANNDQAEIARLEAIHALRQQANEEEEKNLLAQGDANVNAKNDAVAAENSRYEEAVGKTADAAETATQRKIVAYEREGKAIDENNAKLAQQASLYAKVPAGAPTTPGAPTAPASTPTPAPTTADIWQVSDTALLGAIQAQTDMQSGKFDAIIGRLDNVERAVRQSSQRGGVAA
jgi:hypothetical protein